MKEVLYIEVPTPDVEAVKVWLQRSFEPQSGVKVITQSGVRLLFSPTTHQDTRTPDVQAATPTVAAELAIFVWSLQRTTYLKVFRWTEL